MVDFFCEKKAGKLCSVFLAEGCSYFRGAGLSINFSWGPLAFRFAGVRWIWDSAGLTAFRIY